MINQTDLLQNLSDVGKKETHEQRFMVCEIPLREDGQQDTEEGRGSQSLEGGYCGKFTAQ